ELGSGESSTQNEEAETASSFAKRNCRYLRGFRRGALGVELHHADLAVAGDLDIRNVKHGRAFDRARSGARQLYGHALRSRIQNQRRDLERGREFHRRDLEAAGDVNRGLALLRRRELDGAAFRTGEKLQ